MSQQLDELLFTIRQHPAFHEFMNAVTLPEPRDFRPSADVQGQWAEYIHRSGRKLQHGVWLSFLIGEPSQQE